MNCSRCKYHMMDKDNGGMVACKYLTIRNNGICLEPTVLVPPQENCKHGRIPHVEKIPKAEPYDRKKYKMQYGKEDR